MNKAKSPACFIPEKIAKLEDYVPVETDAKIKLDANENPYPVPDSFRDRLAELARNIDCNRYPDPYARELTAKFAEVYGVKPERVVAGCGSDEVLHLLCQTLLSEGIGTLTALPDFSMYAFYAYLEGGRQITARRGADGDIDFDELQQIVFAYDCKCVMFSNPCNPTGAVAGRSEVLDFVRSIACPVIVDEAYGEFCTADFSLLDMAGELPNLIVLKTLSKAFGLAALRVGFAVAHQDIIRAVLRVKSPYNLNSFSQAAGVAALERAQEVIAQAKKIGADTMALYSELKALAESGRYSVIPPGANFVLLRFADAGCAADLHTELLRRGISVRLNGSALRITCGTGNENSVFLREFSDILKDGKNQ